MNYLTSMISLIQIAFYEQAKQILLGTRYFEDNVITHFSASVIAVSYLKKHVTCIVRTCL